MADLPRFFDPNETSNIQQIAADRLAAHQVNRDVSSISGELAGRLASWYPWLDAGSTVTLAQAGVEPDHPAAKAAADLAGKKKHKSGLGWHSIGDVVKGATRTFTTGASELAQEGSALFRQGVSDIQHEGLVKGALHAGLSITPVVAPLVQTHDLQTSPPQTNLQVAAAQFNDTGHVDLGSGFFAGGSVADQQAANARAVASVDGHAVTPGRLLAHAVFEPGSKPYSLLSGLVDATAAIKADPAVPIFNAAGEAIKARKLFTAADAVRSATPAAKAAAGLVEGRRATILPNVADEWLTSNKGRKAVDWLTQEKSPTAIWKGTGKKMPVEVAAQLAGAKTPEDVQSIIRDAAGITLREKPTAPSWMGAQIRQGLEGVRLAQKLPGRSLSIDDLDQSVEQLDRFMKNANLPTDVVNRNLDDWISARSAPEKAKVAIRTVMDQVADQIDRHLPAKPVESTPLAGVTDLAGEPVMTKTATGQSVGKELTKVFEQADSDMRKYYTDEIGNNMPVPGVIVDGEARPVATPHLPVEFLNRDVQLPDARDIRRATSWMAKTLNFAPIRGGTAVADFAMNDIWKPMQLIRGAWTVRVIGEEQIRMAAAGLDSVFSHPLSAIARLTAEDSKAGRLVDKIPGLAAGRGRTGLTEDLLANSDEAQASLARDAAGWVDRGKIRTKYRDFYQRGHAQYAPSWADEIGKLASDPIASKVAGADDLQQVKDSFWSGPLAKFRDQMATQRPLLNDRVTADAYIESVANRVRQATGEHPGLMDAVATGTFEGNPVRVTQGDTRPFVARLRELSGQGVGPQGVPGDLVVSARTSSGAKVLDMKDRAVDTAFGYLMGKPSNYLSRSRTFEQLYWQRVGELMPHMTDEARAAALSAAETAKLSKSELAGLRAAGKVGNATLDLDAADLLAKGHALDGTKRLLYDLADKSQWTDVMRHLFPFGEAWKEMGSVWAKVGLETAGKPLHRLDQVVRGARGSGFFFRDPATGEEMFTYSGSQFLTGKLTGVPVPLTARVQGLNLFSNNPLVPGLGPMVAVPLAKIIPDKPSYDWVRNNLIPIEPDTGNNFTDLFTPAWAKKLQTAFSDPNSDRVFANSVFDTARYLASTGKYDLSTEDGQQKLEDDARRKARMLYVMRGLAQVGPSPSAPGFKWMAKDKDGRLTTAFALTEDFRKMQSANYQTAVGDFLDKYGDDALLFMQPKSQGGFSPTDELHDWVRDHPGVTRDYRDVYGYFAPDGGDFSMNEQERQLATGERTQLKPAEMLQLANNRVAAMIYRTARDKLGPNASDQQRMLLSDLKDALRTEYPGYDPEASTATTLPKQLAQLQQAAGDKRLAGLPVAEALQLYFAARDKALAAARAQGRTTLSGKSVAGTAEWLRGIGQAIAQEYPEFQQVFDDVLSRELPDQSPTQAVA